MGKRVSKVTLRVASGTPPEQKPGAVKALYIVAESELVKEQRVKRRAVEVMGIEGLAYALGAGGGRV